MCLWTGFDVSQPRSESQAMVISRGAIMSTGYQGSPPNFSGPSTLV